MQKNRIILILFPFFLLSVITSCSRQPDENARFVRLANNYLEKMLQQNPEFATYLGDHRFDNRLNDYTMEGIRKNKLLLSAYRDSLLQINVKKLNQTNRIDYEILMNRIKYGIFRIDTLREYEWNALNYNVGGAIYSLIARDFAPLKERLLNVKVRLEQIPEVIEAARENLKDPTRVHTETAILQNQGTINLIKTGLDPFLQEEPELIDSLKVARKKAVEALTEYGKWLKDEVLPNAIGNFRIGDEKYRKKLKYTLESDIPKEDILKQAEIALVETQRLMYETALPLYKKYFPLEAKDADQQPQKVVIKSVLEKLAEDHPNADNIMEIARADLEDCENFVRQYDLVTMPDEPIKVIVMPEFQRGVAVAYCDAPGPLEEHGKTFYAISPPPKNWTPQRVDSYFREYNNYMLKDLTIHEGIPGHYLQLAHSNQFKAPTLIRAIFSSGTFVEGWATYAEQFMAEKGFGGPEVKMQQLKMKLRLIINAIIDQKIHTGNMSQKEAIELMMNEGFQEEGEAVGKWRRASLTSTQLSTYFVGNLEMNAIRKAYMKKMGDKFNLKEFHDRLLSYGSPAPKYVRELLGLD